MSDLRFALFGAGFWARYQLAAWNELPGAKCVAICDPDPTKAQALARHFSVRSAYVDPEELLGAEELDFVDIVSSVDSHRSLVELAAHHRLASICQKPLANSLQDAEAMVRVCDQAQVPFFVHENWRWQAPIRQVKRLIREGAIGAPVRARVQFTTAFDFLNNQPALRQAAKLLLLDLGIHILDTVRFLFGEAFTLVCQTRRVRPDIQGEDMATILMEMQNGITVVAEMAYAGIPVEHDCFPQTMIWAEGERGSLELGPHYWIRTTTSAGTVAACYPPPRYAWADQTYEVVQTSMVACNQNFLEALQGKRSAETTGQDNLETLRLVFAAYDSASSRALIRMT